MKNELGDRRHFVIPLPKDSTPAATISSVHGISPQIDETGRENPSTTALARTEEFRKRVREGMFRAGIGSSFVDSPASVIAAARRHGDLRHLTPFQKQVVDLRYLEGLTQEEVGRRLDRDYRIISKTERAVVQKLRGKEDKKQVKQLLEMGVIDIDLVPGLTDLQRRVLRLRHIDKLTGNAVGDNLGMNFKRVSEVENTALNKMVTMLSQLKA